MLLPSQKRVQEREGVAPAEPRTGEKIRAWKGQLTRNRNFMHAMIQKVR